MLFKISQFEMSVLGGRWWVRWIEHWTKLNIGKWNIENQRVTQNIEHWVTAHIRVSLCQYWNTVPITVVRWVNSSQTVSFKKVAVFISTWNWVWCDSISCRLLYNIIFVILFTENESELVAKLYEFVLASLQRVPGDVLSNKLEIGLKHKL